MKEIMKLGITLFLFCLVAGLALAFTNEMTKDTIDQGRQAKELAAKKAVMMDADEFVDISDDDFSKLVADYPIISSVSEAKKAGELIGYVVISAPSGYGGEIVVVSGVDLDGKITGVRISKHSESPGIGSKSTEPAFYEQYDGKDAATVGVNKANSTDTEIKAISAATITSVAVTSGVNSSGEAVKILLGK